MVADYSVSHNLVKLEVEVGPAWCLSGRAGDLYSAVSHQV